MADLAWMRSVLQIFASRAGAEIQRIQTEEKLQEAVDRYALATGAAKVGVWDWNVQTDEFYLDPNIKAELGYQDDEISNDWKRWLRHVHPEDRQLVTDKARKCIDGRAAEYVLEHRMLHKNGTIRWALVRGRTIRDSERKAVRMIGTNTDITDLKRLEAQLLQAQKMEGVGRLAGGIAHDFNNLLTVILGLTKEIQLDRANPLGQELEDIQQAAERAALLTRQLLAFSRRQMLQPKVLQLNDLVTDLLRLVARLLGEDIKLLTNLHRKTGQVKADPVQMEQIIMNLAANARDAMPEGGAVTIETANVDLDDLFVQTHPGSVEGPYVRLRIRDTGVGMDADTLRRVFEPFFTTKHPDAGTGLGLSMVYGIVKQSGGYVAVISKLGMGTDFDVYLPRIGDASISPKSGKPKMQTGTETVLLVEDEPSLRRFVRRALEREGYAVLEAANGEDALAVFQTYGKGVRVILTDAVMPKMSGAQLVERIRRVRPDIGIVFMSGYANLSQKQISLLEGPSSFIQKPFSIEELTEKLRGAMDGSERQSETTH